jgi:hypothetical protein
MNPSVDRDEPFPTTVSLARESAQPRGLESVRFSSNPSLMDVTPFPLSLRNAVMPSGAKSPFLRGERGIAEGTACHNAIIRLFKKPPRANKSCEPFMLRVTSVSSGTRSMHGARQINVDEVGL